MLLGKMSYNSFGVAYNGGHDDKVCYHVTLCLIRLTFLSLSLNQNAFLKVLRRLGRSMALNAILDSEVPYIRSPHT